MIRLLFVLLSMLLTGLVSQAQVTVCWTPEGGTPTCRTLPAGSVTEVTFDLRGKPIPAVVVQSLPDYQVEAMQQVVDGQTYHQQQADGSIVTKQRYQSVQDLMMQYFVRAVMLPALKLYPPTGTNAGKTTNEAVAADVAAGVSFYPLVALP
jgi:hypothetical protein